LVFVEVKTRTSIKYGQAQEALSTSKLKRFKQAVLLYLVNNKIYDKEVRLDFIAVDIDKKSLQAKLRHFKGII